MSNILSDTNHQEECISDMQVDRSCSLVIPDLLGFPHIEDNADWSNAIQFDSNEFKDLELLLSRSKRKVFSHIRFEEVLFTLFDVVTHRGNALPVAPATYLADTGHNAPAWCMRADPVFLSPDRDQLVLSVSEKLSLSLTEAEHMANELNVLFEEDGWRLEVATPIRWYLHLPEDPQIHTYDLSQVSGRPVGSFMPTGYKGMNWHRIMNEVQMVLHNNVVNHERQINGKLPVSSLWFWGGGKTLPPGHSHWSQLWSDEPVSRGLAEVTRTPRALLPEDACAWLRQATSPGEHIIVLDDLRRHWLQSGIGGWDHVLGELQTKWLTPLLQAVRQSELDRLSIFPCNGFVYTLTSGRLKRWWSRKVSMQQFYNDARANLL